MLTRMLTKFEVRNFRSIKSLDLQLRPFMVLVGPNGAGKTNVIQALALLSDLLREGTTAPAQHVGWRHLIHRERKPARGGLKLAAEFEIPLRQLMLPHKGRTVTEVVPVRFAVTLRGGVSKSDIVVESEELIVGDRQTGMVATREDSRVDFQHATTPDGREFEKYLGLGMKGYLDASFRRRAWAPSQFATINLLGRTLLERHAATSRLRLDSGALRSDARSDVSRDSLGPSGEGLSAVVHALRGTGKAPSADFQQVLETLQRVYPRLEDIETELFGQGRITLNFRERGIGDPVPLDSVSDGLLHALALLVALRQRGTGILAIEEPENALHPWSLRSIVREAQLRHTRRILMTTHSETVVNEVTDPGSLFIVENSEQDGTTVTAATTKESAIGAIIAESGQKLGSLWVDGSLGGVP